MTSHTKRKAPSDPSSSSQSTEMDTQTSQQSEPPRKKAKKMSKEEEAWRKKYGHMPLEEARDKQVATWDHDGELYSHFHMPPEIDESGENPQYKFVCKTFPDESVTRAVWSGSTGNLHRHRRPCVGGKVPADQTSITAFAKGSTYTPGKFRLQAVRWVTVHKRPFAIIEDPPLQEMFTMLNANVKLFSQKTLARDVNRVFAQAQKAVIQFLAGLKGRVHIAFDGWSSPNVLSTLGIKVIYVSEGKIHVVTLDLLELVRAHNGNYLAEVTFKCLQDYGIVAKLLASVCDNASNNDTMLSSLEPLLPEVTFGGWVGVPALGGVRTRIRCFAHIINLVVKAFLTQFDRPKKKKGVALSEDEALYEALDELEEFEDDELDEEEQQALEEVDEEREAADTAEIEEIALSLVEVNTVSFTDTEYGRTAVTKLKLLGRRMRNNARMQTELERCCGLADVGIKPQKMLRAVEPRWNTTGDVVTRGCELQKALDKLVMLDEFKKKLRKLRLTTGEWRILREIQPILKAFKDTTTRVEQSAVPLIYQVIPFIDLLTELMENKMADTKLHPTVRAASARAYAILNKYYSKTDESIMYRMGMVLHPRYKKSYFIHKKWPDEWILTAVTITQDIWRDYYKPTIHQPGSSSSSTDATSTSNSLFADIDNFNAAPQDADALGNYLLSPPENGVTDPIQYWTARLDKPGAPITGSGALARMGLDFLSAPASSADVERDFSAGGLIVSKRRHNLSFESLRKLMVLNSWFREGLVPEGECAEFINKLAKRPKNGGKSKGKGKADSDIDTEEEDEIRASEIVDLS